MSRTLRNLLRAGGIANPVSGMSFKFNMPGSPLPSGTRMSQYVLSPALSITNENPVLTIGNPLISNFDTLNITVNYNAISSPSRLNELGPRSAGIQVLNERDDFGTLRSNIVFNPSPTINVTNQTVTWSGQIQNTREVTTWGNEGAGDAWHSCDLRLQFNSDNVFNSPAVVTIENVRVRTRLAGQGTPTTPPATPNAPTVIYPDPVLGDDYARATVSAAWFGLGSDVVEIQWSLDADFTSVAFSGTEYQFFTTPTTALTLYVRARVVDPYVGPWSDATSVFYVDPRPDV